MKYVCKLLSHKDALPKFSVNLTNHSLLASLLICKGIKTAFETTQKEQ